MFKKSEHPVRPPAQRFLSVALVLLLGGMISFSAYGQGRNLPLPTDNNALLFGQGPDFYMYTDRRFEGQRSRPWQGGKYGFFRNPQRTAYGLVYTRFHAGVDIAPLYRDEQGVPQDLVRVVDDGTVAYVNANPGASNYGKYVVVEHDWGGAPIYTLYAHLNRTDVQTGDAVAQGDTLGLLGYTGRGINRRRAHVHFEINLLVNRDFQQWFDVYYRGANNRHGVFNGMNLRGIDVAGFYRAMQANPTLTIGRFITQKAAFFTVTVPMEGHIDMLERYPWMLRAGERAEHNAWEIAFTRGGVPIGFTPVEHTGRMPSVEMKQDMVASCSAMTGGFLTGRVNQCRLSNSGRRSVELITMSTGSSQMAGVNLPGR